MAVQLTKVPLRLQALASKFERDRDIQTEINNIATKARMAAKSFKSALSKEGSNVLLQKALLMTASPDDINIADVHSSLSSATEAISVTRQHVVCLQTEIHSSIETCRRRKDQHETQLAIILARISKMWSEIENLELFITTNEDEAAVLAKEAAELNEKADGARHAAKQKRKTAELTGVIGGILGVAMAPFTGGSSLAIASAAIGISCAVKMTSVQELTQKANELQNDADKKRRKAGKLKSRKNALMKQRSSLKADIRQIQSKTGRMSEAANVLQQVTSYLLPTIHTIDVLLHAFQDLEAAIKDVSLQQNSFEIIRNAFSNEMNDSGKLQDVYMNKLKEKWDQLERILMQHETQGATLQT